VTHQKYMTHRLPTAPTMCKAIDNPEACKQAATELGIEFLVSQEAPGGCIVNSRKSPNQVSFNTVTPTEIDEDPLDAETFPPCSDGPHGSGPFGTDWFKNSVGQDCSAYADGENCSDDSGAWQHCSGCGHCGDPEPVAVTPTEWTHRLCVRPAAEAATTTTTPHTRPPPPLFHAVTVSFWILSTCQTCQVVEELRLLQLSSAESVVPIFQVVSTTVSGQKMMAATWGTLLRRWRTTSGVGKQAVSATSSMVVSEIVNILL